MQVITLRCPACGSTLKVEGNETHIKCEYCQNPINFIKPLTSNSIVEGLNEIEQNKYSNYLSILEQAMLAGNYTEGYNYCNKGLEINPNSAELWANKAICSLWISTISQISEEKAMEIITYLNACKRNDPNSRIYEDTSKSIAENLYYATLYKYNTLQPDHYNPGGALTYSVETERAIISCLKIMQLCFQIYPEYTYLLQELRLINHCKLYLFDNRGQNSNNALRHGFDAVKVRQKLIEEIRKDYSDEKLENMAQTRYDDFCKLGNEFADIDRNLYGQIFIPLINKYRPQKPPLTPEQLRVKKRNKRICIGIVLAIIVAVIFTIVYDFYQNKKIEEEKFKPVVLNDTLKTLKADFDKKYLDREFLKNDDNTVFAQKSLVFINKNFTKDNLQDIIKFEVTSIL